MAGVPRKIQGLYYLQTEKGEMQREATHSVTDDEDHGCFARGIRRR